MNETWILWNKEINKRAQGATRHQSCSWQCLIWDSAWTAHGRLGSDGELPGKRWLVATTLCPGGDGQLPLEVEMGSRRFPRGEELRWMSVFAMPKEVRLLFSHNAVSGCLGWLPSFPFAVSLAIPNRPVHSLAIAPWGLRRCKLCSHQLLCTLILCNSHKFVFLQECPLFLWVLDTSQRWRCKSPVYSVLLGGQACAVKPCT